MKTIWTKFFDTKNQTLTTYYNETKTVHGADEQEFDYQSAGEAVEKSETCVFIFWDDVAIGSGKIDATKEAPQEIVEPAE